METKYITHNLYVTRNEQQIIDLLVDHHEMPTDFNKSHVISLYSNRDFHLILYFPNESHRGFQMYVVRDFSLHVNDLVILREIFRKLIDDDYGVHMLQKAYSQVENMLYMSKTFRIMMNPDLSNAEDE